MITLTLEEARTLVAEFDACMCPYESCDTWPHTAHAVLAQRIEAQNE